ncbi:uncharacterized protein LOC117650731 [Thrips palmi]|uniref:Uncharacterized protein LOC117650731 n=1 Tax=Thrips palmi TaxID=161013 RepID=A0A6P8ZXS7_THRPL|nr:uncharacterized protein LOC117650731 [Thrips palmi]
MLHVRYEGIAVDHITASFTLHNFLILNGEQLLPEDELAAPIDNNEVLGDEDLEEGDASDEGMGDNCNDLFADAQDAQLRETARLHGELSGAVVQLSDLFAPYLPYYLLNPLGGSALATCGVLFGTFSGNFLSLVPQIFIVFMPLCMNGEALKMASGPWMSESAYGSAWLESSPPQRRMLLLSMARCSRPMAVPVKAFGALDREAFISVLKAWFSYLQTLSNLSAT